MPEIPSLALARLIIRSYLNDDFHPIIVYGDLRIGKSSYALKSLKQALEYLRPFIDGLPKFSTDSIERFMGWNPLEVVTSWLNEEERMPCYIWDDAGYWLHSLNWTDPVLISVMKYMNVVGTDYNTLIFTTPDPTWILSKIANMAGMIRIKVVKRDGSEKVLIDERAYRRFARTAIGYKPWKSPDLKRGGVNKIIIDDFSCKIEDDLYEWYKPIREHYAKNAKLSILKNLNNATRKAEMEEMKTMKKLRTLEKELFEKAVKSKLSGNV
jgi:hypothetical protein